MTYKSLYRKYRPNRFDEVSGQEFIVKTLKNAIATNKISHAYLFCGTRGTGKTTIAKIFARNVNCLTPLDGLPCGKCEICLNENTDEVQDIIEIDAASNNGVDEIRELKNKIKLVPVLCKYKVYIIDEVHMLSTGAFNALLKTLEEPPSHVIFILATTEPQKLPITIISRCQRFDFKKLTINDIESRLKYISEQEKINIDDESLIEISKMADGAMRDAIGLLDQVSSFSSKTITIDDIYQVSGKVSYKLQKELIDNYISSNTDVVLDLIEKIYLDGKDFVALSQDILMFFRSVLISKKAANYFNEKGTLLKEYVNEISNKIDIKQLELIITNFEELTREIKYSDYPRVLFEIYLLKNEFLMNEFSDSGMKEERKQLKVAKQIASKDNNVEKDIKIEEVNKNDKEPSNIIQINPKEAKIIFDSDNNDYKKPMINNTIAMATNECKKDLEKIFLDLNKYLVDKKYKDVATILTDSTICAASTDHILLTYKYVSMVEENDKNINKILDLIKEMTNSTYKLVAITNDEWKEVRPYYVELKKNNGSIPLQEEYEKQKITNILVDEESVETAVDMFGSELIEMEG